MKDEDSRPSAQNKVKDAISLSKSSGLQGMGGSCGILCMVWALPFLVLQIRNRCRIQTRDEESPGSTGKDGQNGDKRIDVGK